MPVTWEWEPIFFITGLGGVVRALAMDLQWLTKIHNSYKCMHYLLYASTIVHRINHFTIQDLPYYTLSTSDGKFRSFYRMFIYRMVRMLRLNESLPEMTHSRPTHHCYRHKLIGKTTNSHPQIVYKPSIRLSLSSHEQKVTRQATEEYHNSFCSIRPKTSRVVQTYITTQPQHIIANNMPYLNTESTTEAWESVNRWCY